MIKSFPSIGLYAVLHANRRRGLSISRIFVDAVELHLMTSLFFLYFRLEVRARHVEETALVERAPMQEVQRGECDDQQVRSRRELAIC